MPMGGGGTRFADQGFTLPKPLIEIHGKPFFYWATRSVACLTPPHLPASDERHAELRDEPADIEIIFVVLQEHVDYHRIDEAIKKFFPDAKIKIIPEVLPGAVCTCLKGVEDITDDEPIIFNDCDHMFSCRALADKIFERPLDFDGALLTFRATEPCFSYVRLDQSGNVVGTVEKKVVSEHAICGAYVFVNARLFRRMSERYLDTCRYKEYFISGVYNEICKAQGKILDLPVDFHVSFGTPLEYNAAKSSPHFDEFGCS